MKYFVEVTKQGTYWYKDAKMTICHREDGPACEHANGNKAWWLNGELHRVDGPAVEFANGAKSWWLNNKKLTEEEHRQKTQPATEMTVAEIEKLLGKKIKIVK